MANARHDTGDLPNLTGLGGARPHHSAGYRVRHRARTIIVCLMAAALVFAGTVAAAVWTDIGSAVKDGELKLNLSGSSKVDESLTDFNAGKPVNILLIGQDSREGDGNSSIGGSQADVQGLHNADTTMVMQIAADRKTISLVSIPRDSLVDVPSCETTAGTIPAQYGVQFNAIFPNAYAMGGLASATSCTLSAVNSLTGLDIGNVVVVDFQGLSGMIDALGGVDLCIPEAIQDYNTGLNLAAGMQHLDGMAATQYARVRYSVGDGSDIMRTTRQQYLIKQLLNEARNKNLFTQTGQLYQLAKQALQSLNISSGLADISTLAGLAMSLKNLDSNGLQAQTVPIMPAPEDPNRRVWTSDADALWAKMRKGEPIFEQTKHDSSKDSDVPGDGTSDTQTDGTGTSDGSTPDGTTSDQTTVPSTGDPLSGDIASRIQGLSPDATTGLISLDDGTLVDSETKGIVDPQSGAIRDSTTGEFIGMADRYLNTTVCAVPAQK